MRAKALKMNAAANLLSEVVVLITGLILPRLIITNYGSDYNGLTGSITQFLSFSVVLRAGVGAVTRAALFKPLADGDKSAVNAIMSATAAYMKKIAYILAGLILGFACVYPFIVVGQYPWFYSFAMVLIMGVSTIGENYFGIKNIILLQADQKYYVQTLFSIISQIISCSLSVILMNLRLDMLIVKACGALAFFVRPLMLEIYVRRNYRIDYSVKPDNLALKQRWDAFAQQIAVILNGNISVVLITIFTVLKNVSVYTVHNMVASNIAKVCQAPIVGLGSAFGNMIAKNESENLKKAFSFMEWAVFALTAFMFSVTAVMLTPFVDIYTSSVTDVNYHRPIFGFLIVIVNALSCLRLPYQYMVEAAGRFKQTRNGAILEVIINLLVSVTMLLGFGVIGVVIGALVAGLIRNLQYSWYSTKYILNISPLHAIKNYVVYFMAMFIAIYICSLLPLTHANDYLAWASNAFIVAMISFVIVSLISMIFNRKDIGYLYKRIKNAIQKNHN